VSKKLLWTTIDARFREPGMAALAGSIRDLGPEAGICIAPDGQSNEKVARESGAFLWKPDGTTASDSWAGKYLLDPSLARARAYLAGLSARCGPGTCRSVFLIADGAILPLALRHHVVRTARAAPPTS
jgi:hypothetical protein